MKKFIVSSLFILTILQTKGQIACSMDNTFATGGKLISDVSRLGDAVVVQPDNKILVAATPFGNGYSIIKRLNVNGTTDATYGIAGNAKIEVAEKATRIKDMVLHNNILYICGTTTTDIGGTSTYVFVAAVDMNGNLIPTFGTGGLVKFNSNPKLYLTSSIVVDNNNKIYICGSKGLTELFVLRLNSNGTLDNSFDTDGIQTISTGNNDHWFDITSMALDKDNKVVVAGKKYRANNGNQLANFWNILVVRFLNNGSIDNTFANNGIGLYNSNPNYFDETKKILVNKDNKYIICGDTYDNVDYDYTILKLQNNGSIDNTFGNNGWMLYDLEMNNEMENPLNAALLDDGSIIITGNQGSGDTVYFALFKVNPNGTRDQNFAPNGLYKNIFGQNNNSSSSGMAVTTDGKIVLAGYTRTCANGVCGTLYLGVARYNAFLPLAINDIEEINTITLYPNPTTNNIFSSKDAIQMNIYTFDGKLLSSYREVKANTAYTLPINTTGAFFVTILSNGELKKFIITKE